MATSTDTHGLDRTANRILKRAVDLVGALTGLAVASPLFLVVPLMIKLDSNGPVFYVQQRVGVRPRSRNRTAPGPAAGEKPSPDGKQPIVDNNRTFRVIKFRTMVDQAERDSGPVWATQGDPRVTRLGKILRKSRLDEIPQFINVLLGQMSLVGPRPERPAFVRELLGSVDGYAERLTVKPGITGLAQVNYGYDTSVDSVAEKVRFDLEYIRTWSLWLDLKIILRTFGVVLTGRGAC